MTKIAHTVPLPERPQDTKPRYSWRRYVDAGESENKRTGERTNLWLDPSTGLVVADVEAYEEWVSDLVSRS